MTRRLVQPLILALVLTASVAVSPAQARLKVGISEQRWQMFDSRHFKRLQVRHARIVVPWNVVYRRDYWPGYLRAWLRGARKRGVEPHVAFNIADFEPRFFGKGPSPKQYRRMVKRFRKKYRGVRVFTPWNEANHSFQPTARRPRLAYRYHRALKSVCPRCTVLAADVLDDPSMTSWIRRFRRYYRGRGPWGLHNYQDANHGRSLNESATLQLARLVPGPIWSTESGGIVGFKTVKGRVAYKYSLRRQVRAQRHLFRLLLHRKVRHRYKRVYIHHWSGTWLHRGKRKQGRWDSGLMSVSGRPRPAYWALKRQIKRLR